MLEPQRRLSSNLLLHTDEDSKFKREQIYVPLALVEKKKPDKREGEGIAEAGTRLYEPNYEEKQRFEHEAFLEQILASGEGKTKGKQIALIGEPGAGKTTLLQTIADWVLEQDLGLPIWISLADLGQQNTFNIWDYLQSTWLSLAISPAQKTIAETELAQQIEQGKIWLLLDGVDEVATTGIETLQAIANRLRGWLSQSRVILTCRLNVWEADKNALADFETYRLLDFDYPQQVHQFIDNWFSNSDFAEQKKRLKTELENPEQSRLCDLIQNPLRLTLLCHSWQSQEDNLPETKAGLYAQFVEQFYKWKSDVFSITYQDKKLLNQALGRLALQDIDTGNTRFRLRESFIREAIGDDGLFEKALELGWLNNVGIAAESPTQERVYAFFHASFEEYFAACAVDDWDYFVPRNHVDKPVEGKKYRIFEAKWKEVILLWLGREDVDEEEKEAFIEALVEFDDGYENFYFYGYRAYFLAATGIAEFEDCSLAEKIVAQIVTWNFGYFDIKKQSWQTFIAPIIQGAQTVLPQTARARMITTLVKFIQTAKDKDACWQAAKIVEKFGRGNPEAITALVRLISASADEHIHRVTAYILGEIDPGNSETIATLIRLIHISANEDTRRQAVISLGRIDPGNSETITALRKLLRTLANENVIKAVIWSLKKLVSKKIGIGNPETINPDNSEAIVVLVKLIRTSNDEKIRRDAAEFLGEIGQKNSEAIAALVDLIHTFKEEDTLWTAVESLGEIGQGNPQAITALEELTHIFKNKCTLRKVAETLGKIDPGNIEAIEALVKIIKTTESEYTCQQVIESLGEIEIGNLQATETLVELVRTFQDRPQDRVIFRSTLKSLEKTGKGNSKAIAVLVELIQDTEAVHIHCEVAEVLGKIGQDNSQAIMALIELIRTSKNYFTCCEAIKSLGKIGQDNTQAIVALIELIRTSKEFSIRSYAAESLEKIGQDNKDAIASAIAALVELIGTAENESTHRQAAESLGKIGQGNKDAIAALVELIGTTKDESTREQAAQSLEKIIEDDQMAGVVTALKNNLSHETWENNRDRFIKCYEIIWKCAQTLSYPEFYQAWHNPPITPHPEVPDNNPVGFTPTVQTLDLALLPQLLHTAITADSVLRDRVQLICLDSSRFIEPDNPAAEIYDQMLDLGCPERVNGEPTTLPQLKLYWHSLRRQSDKLLVMVLYHAANPSPEFSPRFLDALSKFEGEIYLVSDESLSVSLPIFLPRQPNLVEAILGWIHKTILES
jgi:HEAT repeat protein/energy-coupling factor transporter ATP-binding protein EcfA2